MNEELQGTASGTEPRRRFLKRSAGVVAAAPAVLLLLSRTASADAAATDGAVGQDPYAATDVANPIPR